MSPSDFATADIDKVLNDLTTNEAILLTAGVGVWHTHAVDRLGIPAIKVYHSPPTLNLYAHDHSHLLGQRWTEWYSRKPFLHGNTREMFASKPQSPFKTCLALLIPDQSSTALGATWDTTLIEEVGLKLLAEEAKLRAASLVLAPTCNIQRVSCFFFRGGYQAFL